MTCGFATPDFLLGCATPHPRVPFGRISLVAALRADRGESDPLMTCYKSAGQRLVLDKVELGGIEPLRGSVRRTWSRTILPGHDTFSRVRQ